MMEYRRKLRRGSYMGSLVVLLGLCVSVLCLLLFLSLSLPGVSPGDQGKGIHKETELGNLGKLILDMLPDDLAFTIFIPSEETFEHVLNLRANDSLVEDKMDDTYAILSRVMGFSAVPRHLPFEVVPLHKEIIVDSVSGYRLYIWKASNGTLFVNSVGAERVNMRKGEIIVHIMSGVIMDPEFEQSFRTDDEG